MSRSSARTTVFALLATTLGACGGAGTDTASGSTPQDPSTPRAPFGGAATAVPGTIEAEHFDMGGQGVAYHDNDAGNQGGAFRTDEDVDVRQTGDAAGGSYEVSFFEAGEWLNFTISVAEAADYRIELRVSGTSSDNAFSIEIDGEDVTGRVAVPDTGSGDVHAWSGRANVPLPAGEHTLTLRAEGGSFNVNRLRISAMPDSGPWSGTAIALPGEFEAENFDQGGEGTAYHDLTPGNAGGQYRGDEDVDIATTNDTAGGGYDVVEFQPGEWLTYSVAVSEAGTYDLAVRTSSENAGSALHAQVDGQDVTGAIAVADTGGAAYEWTGFSGIYLEAGDHELTLVAEGQAFRMNTVRVTSTPPPPPGSGDREPYHGAPAGVPGVIEAEDFDLGGQGVAYGENVAGNDGGAYRPDEDVDIAANVDGGEPGFEVNNFETGEWLSYTIDVASDGSYDIELRASSAYADSAYRLEVDGADVSGPVTVPNTGDWSSYTWVFTRDVNLSAGTHVLTVFADRQYFNLDSIRISDEAPAPPPPAPGGNATLLFSSGFEGTIDFLPTADCWGTGCWQDIVGLDSQTRFTWPSNLGNGGGRFLMLTDPVQITPLTLGDYMFNRIETVTGPRGTSSRALYQEISRNANGIEPMGTSPAQNEFQFLPIVDVPELYVSFWVKLQPDLVEKMNDLPDGPGIANGGTWRAFFALKTGSQKPDGGPADDGDYRIESYIMTYGGGQPYWAVLGDNNAGGGAPLVNNWSVENRDVPVKVGEWFKFEIYWKRSAGADGRVWMAVDGQVLADRSGPNTGAWNMPINRIMAPMLYSGSRMPVYQWIDDVEVWSGFPPVGANPPYAPH